MEDLMFASLPHKLRRSVLRGATVFALALLSFLFHALPGHAQTLGPDVPSGLSWGTMSYFVGGGSNTQEPIPNGTPASGPNGLQQFTGVNSTAVDSQGNVYFGTEGYIYMVYVGGSKLPALLAAVTTQASPALDPAVGAIYLVAGGAQSAQCFTESGFGFPTFCKDASTALQATFGDIQGMFFDRSDNLYTVDGATVGAVRRIDAVTTAVTSVAGQLNNPDPAFATTLIGDGGPATSAQLSDASGIRVDVAGNLYIADAGNLVVRVVYEGGAVPAVLTAEGITPHKGYIYTVAGQAANFCASTANGGPACNHGGPALQALFASLGSIEVDATGNIYITDDGANTIGILYAGGTVPPLLKTVTDTPTPGDLYDIAGQQFVQCSTAPCGDGGPALQAQFGYSIPDAHVDAAGNLYVADPIDNTVRRIDASGYISDSAGTESPNNTSQSNPPTGVGGPIASAVFTVPFDFAIDAQSNLYVVDKSYIWQAPVVKAQTIDFAALAPVTYGVQPIALDAVANDSQGNPTGLPITYTVTGPATVSGTDLLITGAGTVAVTASQAGNSAYGAAASVTQNLTVNPATLTVSAQPTSKIYQTPNPSFTAAITGFVSPDTQQAALTGAPAFSTTADTNSNAGSYPIAVAQGSLAFTKPAYQTDYTLAFVPGTLTITGATPQTITFGALAPASYGQAPVALTATASSQQPVTYTSSNPVVAAVSGSTLTIHGAGTVTITATQVGNNTYAAAPPVTQTLTINPAPLTVTGPVFSVLYGSAINPAAFPVPTITGFVGSDTQALVTGLPLYTTTATSTSPVGSYSVQVAQGGLQLTPAAAADYTFAAFNSGTLTIAGKSQTISFAQLFNTSFSTPPPQPFAVASSGLPVTFNVTGAAYFFPSGSSATTNPAGGNNSLTLVFTGIGPVTITATQPGNAEYAAATPVTQTFTITPGTLHVGVNPGAATRTFGAANPTFGFSLDISVPGDFPDIPSNITGLPTITTTATPDSPPGVYPVVITAGTLVAPNYNLALSNGTLTILPAGSYTITSAPASLTIPRGQSRQVSLTVTPNNLYQGTITLSCGSLPANVTCIFSPSTYTFTGIQEGSSTDEFAAQGTLTINTVGGETVVGAIPASPSAIQRASILLLPAGLAGLLLLRSRRRFARYRAVWQLCLLAMLTAGALGLSSCGSSTGASGGAFAAPGTTNLVITGTGTTAAGTGNVTSSMNLGVTIQ